MAGLQRSGGTVLSAILNQNPAMHSAPASPLFKMYTRLANTHEEPENLDYRREDDIANIYYNIPHAFYASNESQYIVDKNYNWVSPLGVEIIQKFINSNVKIICPVRNIVDILTSYDTITTSTTSVTEGSSMTFTVNTTGVPNGATLYYDLISVTGTLQTTDFGTPSSLTNNSFTITNNTATVTLSPQTDGIDDTDTFYIGIKLSTSGSYVLQSSTITINNLGVILPSLSSMRTIANAGATRRVTAPLNVSVGDYLLIFAGATYTSSNTLYNDIDPGANAGNLGGTSTSTANNPSAAGQTSRWRLLRTQGTTTSDSYIGVFYKIADAHDVNLSATSGSYVVNCYNVGAAGDNQSIFSFRIPGATTTDVMGGDVVNGSAISLTMGSITTTVPNALVMYFYVNESGNYTHTVPTGFTFGGSLGAGAAASAHWGYKTQTTAGATGSVVVSKSSSGNGSVAFMIAFK